MTLFGRDDGDDADIQTLSKTLIGKLVRTSFSSPGRYTIFSFDDRKSESLLQLQVGSQILVEGQCRRGRNKNQC